MRLARRMVVVLPGFGRWASAIRDFETPYGSAGIRQLEVLYALRHNVLDPAIPPATALADLFQIQRSVVTRVLAKLEAAGYITRRPDPSDHRARRIELTESGRLLSDYVAREYFAEMSAALGDVNEDDLDILERAMEILTRAARTLTNGATHRIERIAQEPAPEPGE
jgi:DNA-binding MarR family transcriptional regulator